MTVSIDLNESNRTSRINRTIPLHSVIQTNTTPSKLSGSHHTGPGERQLRPTSESRAAVNYVEVVKATIVIGPPVTTVDLVVVCAVFIVNSVRQIKLGLIKFIL